MIILKIEPGKIPKETEIDGSLTSMQEVVGGLIQAVYPFDEPVALVCNEEGKIIGLPPNRALHKRDTGKIYDIIYGTFFLCNAPSDSEHFESLTPSQITRFSRYFRSPEAFFNTPDGIVVFSL